MVDNSILSRGIVLYRQANYTDALAFFLSLPEESHPDSIELAYYIGLCYARLHRFDDALLYLEQVVTAGKNIQRVLQCRFLLAVIYAMSGRKRLADFELNKLLETGYKKSSVYAALAYIAWGQGDAEKSLEYYKKALESDPENSTALNGMAYVLACENKDLAKALSLCKKALANSPESAACMDSLGWIYFKLGLDADAQKFLQQALEKMPDNVDIAEHIRQSKAG
jgi:tetratricopeptide (TPR) repeat protein